MRDTTLRLDHAVDLTRTGDVWLFRGHSLADRAIQTLTNAPVNHVGMAVVLDDLPPLMWHAELGHSLVDVWTGRQQRGVQLHDLREAVLTWGNRYGQQAWLRQLDRPVTADMEDAVLRSIARLDGTPFPSSARLARRWAVGRVPDLRGAAATARRVLSRGGIEGQADGRHVLSDLRAVAASDGGRDESLESAYCAEVIALTYEAMGLLPGGRLPSWYDPGRFWSGDDLDLLAGYALGGEIKVSL